jgi:hypothetical protein
MAYEHFIPTVWDEGILVEQERKCVFLEDCNRQYEGEAKKKGDTVRIVELGDPTIHTMERKNANAKIQDPEEIEDASLSLVIDQLRYYNYKVGDIDKAQAIGGIMETLKMRTAEKFANEIDRYIAKFAIDSNITTMFGKNPVKVVKSENPGEGEKNVLEILDDAIQIMQERDITSELVLTASPRFIKILRQAYIIRDTDNSMMLKNGRVGMYGNLTLKMSNNVERSGNGAVDNIMLRTKRAIAFAQTYNESEAYRPEGYFADAIKGLTLFGGKIVFPKEVLNLNVRY